MLLMLHGVQYALYKERNISYTTSTIRKGSNLFLPVTQVDFPKYDVQPYPGWVFGICIFLSTISCIFIPIIALHRFIGFLWRCARKSQDLIPYDNNGYVTDMEN